MRYLVDTNVVIRWIDQKDPAHGLSRDAVTSAVFRGDEVYVTPQNLIEFWNVATRPVERNGLGLPLAQVTADLERVEAFFLLAPDSPEVYQTWKRIVLERSVSGVKVHDARLVAVMEVHSLSHILTFNDRDFIRHPGITVVHPREITDP